MMRHDESLLWEYAAQELEQEEVRLVELHLEECPECQERLQAVEYAREQLADANPVLPVVQWARSDERIGALVEKRLQRQAARRWLLGGGLAVLVLGAAAGLSAVMFLAPQAPPPVPPLSAQPVPQAPPPDARVEKAQGLTLVGSSQPVLEDGAQLKGGDVLRTGLTGRAFVHLPDSSHVRVGSATQVVLTRAEGDDIALSLERGRLAVRASHQPRKGFVVRTGGVTVFVVGTTFSVAEGPLGVDVAVAEGRVRVEDARGETRFVDSGQSVRFEPRGRVKEVALSPALRQELAEVAEAADTVSAVERQVGAAPRTSSHPPAVEPARGGTLPRLGSAEASARQVSLPAEEELAPEPRAPALEEEKIVAEPPTQVEVEGPGTAFPSLAGGSTRGVPPKRDEEPAAQAPIPGGPLTMVVPTLPPPSAPAADAASEWASLPAAQEPAQGKGLAHDLETLFLQRAEAAVAKGTCERFMLGLEEVAGDSPQGDRSEAARILRARCYDTQLRPRQAMNEYRKYVDEYPAGKFSAEARGALGQ